MGKNLIFKTNNEKVIKHINNNKLYKGMATKSKSTSKVTKSKVENKEVVIKDSECQCTTCDCKEELMTEPDTTIEVIDIDTTPFKPELEDIKRKFTIGDILGRVINDKEKQVGLIDIFKDLRNLKDTNSSGKFAYFTAKNTNKLTSIYSSITKKYPQVFTSKYTFEEHNEFEAARQELQKEVQEFEYNLKFENALKGEDGKPMLDANGQIIMADEQLVYEKRMQYNKDIDNRMKKYEPIFNETEQRQLAYNKMLNVELVDIDLHKISKEFLPSGITGYQLELISPWIIE